MEIIISNHAAVAAANCTFLENGQSKNVLRALFVDNSVPGIILKDSILQFRSLQTGISKRGRNQEKEVEKKQPSLIEIIFDDVFEAAQPVFSFGPTSQQVLQPNFTLQNRSIQKNCSFIP